MTSPWLTMTGLGRLWSGEQMELRGRPNSRPWVGESEVGDRGRPSSCVLEPLQKGQLIRDLFLLKDFCWPGSAGRRERKRWAAASDVRNIKQWNFAVSTHCKTVACFMVYVIFIFVMMALIFLPWGHRFLNISLSIFTVAIINILYRGICIFYFILTVQNNQSIYFWTSQKKMVVGVFQSSIVQDLWQRNEGAKWTSTRNVNQLTLLNSCYIITP